MFKKNIWIYWEQGWNNAPEICKLCKQSWQKLNVTWNINILDKNNINKFIDVEKINKNFWNITPIQSRADIIRTLLLQKYGGVWVDSTLICMIPLDNWLFKNFDLIDKNDFFAFKKLEKELSISNWFLATHPNNYIINKFTEKYTKFFKTNLVTKEYFQFHNDFKYLLKTDKFFNQNFFKNNKLCSRKARIFTCKFGFNNYNNNIDKIIKIYNSPLYKLSHKIKIIINKETIVTKLFSKIGININQIENNNNKVNNLILNPITIKKIKNSSSLINNYKNNKTKIKNNKNKTNKNKANKNTIKSKIISSKMKIIKIKK
jgi:hypothetical protein